MPCQAAGIESVTAPSKDITLSFLQPEIIASIHVKEGDSVKPRMVLVRQDDAAAKARLSQLEAEATNTARIRMAEAQSNQKKILLDHIEKAADQNAVSSLELEQARLDSQVSALSLDIEKFMHAQAGRKYEEEKIRIKKMTLKSPVSGKVEKIFVHKGEIVDRLAEVIRVVTIDPLWIDVPVPLSQARALSSGQAARVEFFERNTVVDGKILHVSAMADSASETLSVRVEVKNKAMVPAGERVNVVFMPVQ